MIEPKPRIAEEPKRGVFPWASFKAESHYGLFHKWGQPAYLMQHELPPKFRGLSDTAPLSRDDEYIVQQIIVCSRSLDLQILEYVFRRFMSMLAQSLRFLTSRFLDFMLTRSCYLDSMSKWISVIFCRRVK